MKAVSKREIDALYKKVGLNPSENREITKKLNLGTIDHRTEIRRLPSNVLHTKI